MNMGFNISKLCIGLFWAVVCANVFMLTSCGEDRTYEYVAKTENSVWIYEQMKDKYLYAPMLKEQTPKDYFSKPTDFFAKLVKMGENDKWSYIVVDTIPVDPLQRGYFNHLNSYGIDYVLVQDPSGATTRSMVRIINVVENSPADKAGLMRNDFIDTFDNGYKFSTKNVERLVKGGKIKLNVMHLAADMDSTAFYWTDDHIVELTSSEYVEEKAFSMHKTFRHGGKTVGYVMANRLTESNNEVKNGHSDYKADMDDVFEEMKNKKVEELVLDLRLCNCGSFEMACRMASYVVSDADLNKVFAKRTWNEMNSAKNDSVRFDQSLAGKTLGMKRVFVITSKYTQGAAEWVIMALKHALGSENVILVGTPTAGQNVYTENVANLGGIIHIFPAVAKITDGANETFESYQPDVQEDEFKYYLLLPYGNQSEVLLRRCLEKME